jgi:hypothetical protein
LSPLVTVIQRHWGHSLVTKRNTWSVAVKPASVFVN